MSEVQAKTQREILKYFQQNNDKNDSYWVGTDAMTESSLISYRFYRYFFAPLCVFVLNFLCFSLHAIDQRDFEEAKQNREQFWAKQSECLHWFQGWKHILNWNPPYAEWFLGGKLNACYNCLDRHMETVVRDKIALFWEGERGETKQFTFADLHDQVCRFSNALKSLGIKKGDVVAIYLPTTPEAVIAMLSCARIGAIHTVVFAGFSAEALKDRLLDANAKLLITADGSYRKGKTIPLKKMADMALKQCPCVKQVIVLNHLNETVEMNTSRDYWYHELIAHASEECPCEQMDAEDILFLLYTSGTTGKPKGIIHTTGGYLVGVTMTTRWVFDPQPSDIYWCTADIGWITGHSYVVYGILSNGMTQLIYEGAPDFPSKDRYCKLIEKYGVSILYTSPTAIRTFKYWGKEFLNSANLNSLRLLGSVGEPIDPDTWQWYHDQIGQGRCPIVDTWWQTETGSIMISPIPGLTSQKPGSASLPLPGVDLAVLNENGEKVVSGALAILSPWPSMLRGIQNDPLRYEKTYWKQWDGRYFFTGDGAMQDKDGYFWLQGRIDDVINVSGHRLSTVEIESALATHPDVAEAAAIAVSHLIKGQAIVCFVIPKVGSDPSQLEERLKQHLVEKIGAIARPEKIILISELPKTRSGKVMRRLLRDIAEGNVLGDLTTLMNPAVIDQIKNSN